MSKLICIIGTDGSGKTTLANSYVVALQMRGMRAKRVWLGAESVLMAPVRRLLKLVWKNRDKARSAERAQAVKRTTTSTPDYRAEIARKNALVQRYPWAIHTYLALVWVDYRMQVWLKRRCARAEDIIVADRYLFDVSVNLGLTLGWSPDDVVSFIRRRLSGMQLPEFRVFLRVSPEVSLSRKDDIPDIEYLRLRFSYYEAIARAFGFVERDGTLPIETNRDWLVAATAHEARVPYVMYVHANNSDIGGADKVLALMAQHMRDYGRPDGGCRVAVCLRLETSIVAAHAAAGVPVILHRFVRPQTSRGATGLIGLMLRAPATLWFFWQLFRRERPDIVHLNDLYDILPAIAARTRGIPVVWHIRMIKTHPRMRAFFAWAVPRFSSVSISVSTPVRDHYFPRPIPSHQALVVHDLGNAGLITCDHNPGMTAPRPSNLPEGGRLVVMVGRIEPWKGQMVFIDAIAQLPEALRRNAVFALVGSGVEAKEDYLSEVQSRATKVGVIMLGQRDDVPALLRAADISVHASTEPDPFPGVVIESLLSGAATVASASGGAIEMIRPGLDGLLCPPGDASALSKTLEALLSDRVSPRARFGAAGRARALSLVDAAVIDGHISETYTQLATKQSGPHPPDGRHEPHDEREDTNAD